MRKQESIPMKTVFDIYVRLTCIYINIFHGRETDQKTTSNFKKTHNNKQKKTVQSLSPILHIKWYLNPQKNSPSTSLSLFAKSIVIFCCTCKYSLCLREK